MRREPIWVSKSAVLAFHERLVAEHGGAAGLRDEPLLDAALARPRNQFAYGRADLFMLAAAYAFGLTRNHPFVDGNKRVGLVTTGVFLELNGYALRATEQEAAVATRALAAGEIDESAFARWLEDSSRGRRRLPRRSAARRVRRRAR